VKPSRLLVPLLALAALPAAASAGGHASRLPALVRLTSTPALYPAYSPAIHDYVVRCTAGTPVRFTTWAAAGTTALIGGAPGRTRIVRLAPDAAVTVEGRSARGATDYHVRCLPPDFPTWTQTGTLSSRRWYVLTPSLSLGTARSHYVAIFDGHGVPVWWYRTRRVPIDAKILPGPAVAFASYPASSPEYQVRRLDGSFVRKVVSPDGRIDDHELQLRGNGDFVYLVYQPRRHVDLTGLGGPADATVLEAHVEEVTPGGKLVWSWASDDHLSLEESSRWYPTILGTPIVIPGADNQPETAYDFFHANAISVTKSTILLSLRQTDAVYAIDRTTGRILWKLGGTTTPESLTVVGDPYADAPLGGQHDARLLPDGTVSIFDDGTFLNRPPRVVRYRIDPVARTATLVQQIVDPGVTVSFCCGSSRLLANGDWLVSWGGDPVVGEYRPDGTPVFRLTLGGGLFSYRAVPVAPGRLTSRELRAGMDAMAGR
jgi:Arylsulfotransferase (ASST)